MQNTLTGKVALVTGASRGIGRAIALKLAAEGAAVVINYHGSMEKAKEVKAEIESDGGIAEIMQCNVADYQATEAMIRKVTDDLQSFRSQGLFLHHMLHLPRFFF